MNGLEVKRAFLSSMKRSGSNSAAVCARPPVMGGGWDELLSAVKNGKRVSVPVGPQRSFLRCMMNGAYKHLVPAGTKYGMPPIKDGQTTSTVGVL